MLPVSQLYHRMFLFVRGMKPNNIPLTMLCLNLAVRSEGGQIQVRQPKVRKPEKFSFLPVAWKTQDEF